VPLLYRPPKRRRHLMLAWKHTPKPLDNKNRLHDHDNDDDLLDSLFHQPKPIHALSSRVWRMDAFHHVSFTYTHKFSILFYIQNSTNNHSIRNGDTLAFQNPSPLIQNQNKWKNGRVIYG
jgi:hypothetical protein